MDELFENLSQDQANTCGLVLTSSGIVYTVRKRGKGWNIIVDKEDHEKALTAVKGYFDDNPDVLVTNDDTGLKYPKTFTGFYVAFILLVSHIAVFMSGDVSAFHKACGSSASDVLHGELYRAVTSLMLHSGALHLVGNMAGIAIFGTCVCLITGQGVGWMMIVLSGILGNLLNAFFYKTGHLSIGASTAVFGAIGILAGYNFLSKFRSPDQRIKAWLPLGGGLALLGLLGSGKNSDIGAHFFGFVFGILLGVFYAYLIKYPLPKKYQVNCSVISFCVIVFSWMIALNAM
jgi:rhomboid protease GluP